MTHTTTAPPVLSTMPAPGVAERYRAIRAATEELIGPLEIEDMVVQAMPDTSPTRWHLAHTTWFFETFVLKNVPGYHSFHPQFEYLFNSYYNTIGPQWSRPTRGVLTRPTVAEVHAYRERVDGAMRRLLETGSGFSPEVVELGLNHEQQHQELILTDIKHALSFNPLASAYARRWPMASVRPQPLRWFGHEGGLVDLGHSPSLDGDFCFDNETPRHRAFIAPFELASRPVSYGEYLAFIDDRGYQRPELWLAMGWDWVCSGEREAPLYWRRADGRWLNHTLQGVVEIDPHTPVCHLSFFEADAYARWAGARLPSEAEWEFAARRATRAQTAHPNFADRGAFHPLPQAGSAIDEPVQMFGDVWEWTQSSYGPYPGYRPLSGAVGEYNGKFMCNQYVLRGGSCATPAGHMRASYRNFFPPDAQWQFSGLRLAR